jgi:hypothetical protein
MTGHPNNEKQQLADTKSMLRLRTLKLRKAGLTSQRLLKVKQQILQRIVERLS